MSKAKWIDAPNMPHLREPGEESIDLYPGLVVYERRKTGSITAGQSSLPLWAFIVDVVHAGFPKAAEEYSIENAEMTGGTLAGFLYWLLEQRGDFARLLLVLADVERQAHNMEQDVIPHDVAWWYHPEMKERVRDALQRCLDALEREANDEQSI
jgi:hypothetical protein